MYPHITMFRQTFQTHTKMRRHDNVENCGEDDKRGDEKHLPNNILKMVGCAMMLVRIPFLLFTNTSVALSFHTYTHSDYQNSYFPLISTLSVGTSLITTYSYLLLFKLKSQISIKCFCMNALETDKLNFR